MGCRGSALFLAVLVFLLAPGCRLAITGIEVDRPLSLTAFDSIEVGSADRTQVLEELGPPDKVHYTIGEKTVTILRIWHGREAR